MVNCAASVGQRRGHPAGDSATPGPRAGARRAARHYRVRLRATTPPDLLALVLTKSVTKQARANRRSDPIEVTAVDPTAEADARQRAESPAAEPEFQNAGERNPFGAADFSGLAQFVDTPRTVAEVCIDRRGDLALAVVETSPSATWAPRPLSPTLPDVLAFFCDGRITSYLTNAPSSSPSI